MTTPGGSNGNGHGAPEGADAPDVPRELEPERSPSGRVIVRSSSHPPRDPLAQATRQPDTSGVRPWPEAPAGAGESDEERRKKATPDERPRRARRMARERANTPAARPTGRRMVAERPISPVAMPAPISAQERAAPTPQPRRPSRPQTPQTPQTARASSAARQQPGPPLASPPPKAPAATTQTPSAVVQLPSGPYAADRLHEVPIQQRSSAPPPRSPWRSPTVRAALAVALAIVIGSLVAVLSR